MGFFDRFLSKSTDPGPDASGATTATLTCDSCGCDVDYDDMEEGQCPDCRGEEYTGVTYCCGVMYEDGEDTCMSCGEPL